MKGAVGKEQIAATHGKFKSRIFFWIGAILFFLIVSLIFSSAVPLKFHMGHKLITIESGFTEPSLPWSFGKPFEMIHATWLVPSGDYTENNYQFRLGRCVLRVAVETKNTAMQVKDDRLIRGETK